MTLVSIGINLIVFKSPESLKVTLSQLILLKIIGPSTEPYETPNNIIIHQNKSCIVNFGSLLSFREATFS